MHFLGSIHLDGAVSLRFGLQHVGLDIAGAVAANPAVDTQLIAARAAQQLIHRHTELLALDIPKCLINTRDSAHDFWAAAIETAAVHDLPMIFNIGRVFTDEIIAELLHRGTHRVGTTLDDGFAPAIDPLVGRNLQKQPSRWYLIQGQIGNFHLSFLHLCAQIAAVNRENNASHIVRSRSSQEHSRTLYVVSHAPASLRNTRQNLRLAIRVSDQCSV